MNSTTLLSGVTYDPFGPANYWAWGDGVTFTRNFNTDGNISTIVAGSTITLHYDNALRTTSAADNYGSGYTWALGYDLLDRITSASKSGTAYGWTYDGNGNRLTQTGSNASTFTPSTTSNQLNTVTGALGRTYGYDAAGNTASYTGNSFTFNQRGRLRVANFSATTTNYIYSALGQLIEKYGSGGTTLLMYDEAGHLLGEYSSTGALIQETVWMGNIPVATLRPNGSSITLYYVQTDQLNAPHSVSRTSDHRPMWLWQPDPFGTAAPNQNPYGFGTFVYNLRFPGQYYQAESGLNYNYFRDYDPQTGRYIESDPIGFKGGQLSTYAYASGNPLSIIDRFGLGPEQPSPLTALEEAVLTGNTEQAQMLAEAAGLSNAEVDAAVARAAANANKITHVFGKAGHNLEKFVKACGTEGKALQALKDAAAKATAALPNGVVEGLSVTVNGVVVTVDGIVINGQFNLGTAYIP